MEISKKAKEIVDKIDRPDTKLGDLRTIAKEIKKDHALATELWNSGGFFPRQLAILIMDPKQLNQEEINRLDNDMQDHDKDEKLALMDWLLANQLMKDKKLAALIETWKNSKSDLQRRTFWYHQARLRWVGQTPPDNTEELLKEIEKNIENEVPEVQWAMNFTAAQIDVFDEKYRQRCVALGEKTGLYKDELVAKTCVPSYLPLFIPIQVAKQKK